MEKPNTFVEIVHNNQVKTVHKKIAKRYNRSGVPEFKEPFAGLVGAAYDQTISEQEFLEEFLRAYMT